MRRNEQGPTAGSLFLLYIILGILGGFGYVLFIQSGLPWASVGG